MNKLPLCLLFCFACAAPTLEPFAMTGECQATCQAARIDCRAQGTRSANRCFRTCSGSECFYCENAGRSVENVCLGDVEDVCGDSPYDCAAHDFRAHVGGHDIALEERCVEYMESCHAPEDARLCPHFAQVDDPTNIAVYECLSRNACDTEVCPMPPPDAELAALYLSEIESCGWTSSSDEAHLAADFGWLRTDVRDALRGCLAMSCSSGRVHCANAWVDTVFSW